MVAELGSGSGAKTRAILERSQRQAGGVLPHRCLRHRAGQLRAGPGAARPPCFRWKPATWTACARGRAPRARPDAAGAVPGQHHRQFRSGRGHRFPLCHPASLIPGDALLLGTDLVKPVEQLLAAYDDPAGVTAAFNLNLLARINRELDGRLRPRANSSTWCVTARKPSASRCTCASRIRQTVRHPRTRSWRWISAAQETIWTEACHKFRPEQICAMARAAGFRLAAQWVDEEWPFAESLLVAA